MVIKILVPQDMKKFIPTWKTFSFWRIALLGGVILIVSQTETSGGVFRYNSRFKYLLFGLAQSRRLQSKLKASNFSLHAALNCSVCFGLRKCTSRNIIPKLRTISTVLRGNVKARDGFECQHLQLRYAGSALSVVRGTWNSAHRMNNE